MSSTMPIPHISSESLELDLGDHAPVYYAQLTRLKRSVLISVGSAPLPFALAQDWSVAMPRANQPSSSTSLSPSTQSSLALAAKLSRRYNSQIFLSLDLTSSATSGIGGQEAILPTLERALMKKLDPILKLSK